jgi:hypothetical protein
VPAEIIKTEAFSYAFIFYFKFLIVGSFQQTDKKALVPWEEAGCARLRRLLQNSSKAMLCVSRIYFSWQ